MSEPIGAHKLGMFKFEQPLFRIVQSVLKTTVELSVYLNLIVYQKKNNKTERRDGLSRVFLSLCPVSDFGARE